MSFVPSGTVFTTEISQESTLTAWPNCIGFPRLPRLPVSLFAAGVGVGVDADVGLAVGVGDDVAVEAGARVAVGVAAGVGACVGVDVDVGVDTCLMKVHAPQSLVVNPMSV